MNLIDASLRRPVTVILCTVALVLFGKFAIGINSFSDNIFEATHFISDAFLVA